MKITCTRLDAKSIKNLSNMIGQKFEKYRCDEFKFAPSVYQIVGLYVGGCVYALLNETELLDYFGEKDDVSVMRVDAVNRNEIKSHLTNGRQIDTPINQIIQDIIVITDTEYMSKDGVDLYRYDFTAAIVFVFSDRQVVFERDCWFSEDILIYRGPDAIKKISSSDENASDSSTLTVRTNREIVHLSDNLRNIRMI